MDITKQSLLKAGISRQTVSLIERNDFTPSILTAIKLQESL